MTNANKAKGSRAEAAVVEALRTHGFPHSERRIAGSQKDRGDIAGVPGVVIEVKDHARMELGVWVDECEVERQHDNAWLGVVWHKRRGRGSALDWHVTMTGRQFVRLLRKLHGAP